MKMTTHWGDLPSKSNNEIYVPDVSGDIERSMNKLFLNEIEDLEQLYQNAETIQLPSMDPLMLHAIALHKYANNLLDRSLDEKLQEIKFPKMPQIERKHERNCLNYIPQEFSDFALGHDVEVPEISKIIVQQILTKCLATMFSQIGYESSDQSALDIMSDVLELFFKTITRRFKLAQEEEEKHQTAGFPNVIERVLTEMGLGGIKGIHDYYQNRVLKYISVLEQRCIDLNASLKHPRPPSPVDKTNKVVRVKVEQEDVAETENTEVHFSTIDGDVNLSILETGYQLLNSLEEANLQSVGEGEEDPATAQTLGVVSLSAEGDLSHISQLNKKKRFK